ncbi:MAG: acetyl-CoA carboxylase carboxyltransferase subunit alpha [Bdellovibrionales bacterium]|nr:acetyl-CoA carboxylase carboxyltransferase subunit alpha [Bdellovibrionales bacterium]
MEAFFEFEKPIVALEKKLQDLRDIAKQEGVDFGNEIKLLEKRVAALIEETYANLGAWQRVQLSRHPNRPYARDYVDAIFPDFQEICGDRTFGDDPAILGGVGTFKGVPVMILANQKGRTTKQKMERSFGMAKPEGYRKAIRLMNLAKRSRMPILTLIDTPGAFPGIEAEERGQAQAIAESIRTLFEVDVPVFALVIGEGGSGGALALGVADHVAMLEYSTYSVISPESCAAILFSDSSQAESTAEKMRLTPPDLMKLGVIDSVIEEPLGGSHRDWEATFKLVLKALEKSFAPLIDGFASEKPAAKVAKTSKASKSKANKAPKAAKKTVDLRDSRLEKFRKIGKFALAHTPASGFDDSAEIGPDGTGDGNA